VRKFSLVWLLAGLFCLAPVRGQATIINTLRGFSDTEAGWSGGMAASYGASGGNTEETHLRASAQLQYRSGDEIFRLLGSGKRSSSAGQETARAVMGHLRHNHRLSDRWSSLSFLQVQENPFQQLKSRTLLGLGGRWDVTAGPQRRKGTPRRGVFPFFFPTFASCGPGWILTPCCSTSRPPRISPITACSEPCRSMWNWPET
jgi:putative salt-induced outer membrane protein YdiY